MEKKHIILLHGWGGSAESLKSLANNLQNYGFETHSLEMPGHGKTEVMDSPWSMKHFSVWLKDYIDKKNIRSYILLGHSFGGRIIIDSVINQTLKPSAIVLINSSGVKPKNTIKRFVWGKLSLLGKVLKINNKVKEFVYRFIIRESDYLKTSGNLRETFKIINSEYYDERLSLVATPTLIIWGKDDTYTPLWMGKKINDNIDKSKLVILDGTHGLPLKKPEEVANHINIFLKNL